MELKEFVSKTLMQILEGIEEAQSILTDEGGSINPDIYGTAKGLTVYGGRELEHVEFDVAVTITEN